MCTYVEKKFYSILFYSILFYSVNIEAKNVVKDFFIKGEKIITWNGISSTSIQMYNAYKLGFSPVDNEKLLSDIKQCKMKQFYDANEILYIKNKYELIRNLFSFTFYCKRHFSSKYFFLFNINFFDNTNFKQKERVRLKKKDDDINIFYEAGAERIGVLSILFGIGFYWFNKNNLKLSSSFSLGFLWARDNAMVLANYKCDKGDGKVDIQYYAYSRIYFDKCILKDVHDYELMFRPFHYFTWMHGDILFKFEILSIQYKHFYIGCTWKRGIFDTIKVLKYKWWKCLPSTISVEIGYILK